MDMHRAMNILQNARNVETRLADEEFMLLESLLNILPSTSTLRLHGEAIGHEITQSPIPVESQYISRNELADAYLHPLARHYTSSELRSAIEDSKMHIATRYPNEQFSLRCHGLVVDNDENDNEDIRRVSKVLKFMARKGMTSEIEDFIETFTCTTHMLQVYVTRSIEFEYNHDICVEEVDDTDNGEESNRSNRCSRVFPWLQKNKDWSQMTYVAPLNCYRKHALNSVALDLRDKLRQLTSRIHNDAYVDKILGTDYSYPLYSNWLSRLTILGVFFLEKADGSKSVYEIENELLGHFECKWASRGQVRLATISVLYVGQRCAQQIVLSSISAGHIH
jgi:hypothetical protein